MDQCSFTKLWRSSFWGIKTVSVLKNWQTSSTVTTKVKTAVKKS